VSVTSGILCVDFRKFFCSAGTDEIKPTRSGVALHLNEKWKFVEIIKSINDSYPILATTVPCYTGNDHLNQRFSVQNATRLKLTELTVRTNSDVCDSM